MSTATTEASTENSTRRTASRSQRQLQDASRRQLVEAREHTEAAVSDFVTAAAEAVRAFTPTALLRPTEAVDYTFDVAEQMLAAWRRICLEIAAVAESGLQGSERRST
jgi:hypothetical protein